MREATSRADFRNPFFELRIERKSEMIWATREIFPTRAARFSSYHVSTLVTADFNSAPTVFIFVATGPMNDPSSVRALRAFS